MSDASRIRSLLDLPVQVVAGKGGVGRSVLASALALRASQNGERTLLVEVNAPDNCARYLGVDPAPDTPREVMNNLWLCRTTPAGSLREYALMILKFKTLYNFVFENPFVRYFLKFVPSLAEYTQFGKIWYHGTEKHGGDGAPRFDRIIVDAPATGHAVTLLSVARVVADTVPKGVMKDASEQMATLVETHDRACLHVVATPEEMPVNEGLQLYESARTRLRMRGGLAILNRLLSPLVASGDRAAVDQVLQSEDPALAPYVNATRRRLDWEQWQRDCREKFAAKAGGPLVVIPDLGAGVVDRAFLDSVVQAIDAAAQGTSDA